MANFPNFTITNDVHIPPKASPGWNFYLPIPFSKNCRITLRSDSAKNGAAMIDWQQYREGVELTPLRFHAQRNIALPGVPREPFPIAETEGTGFLAGYIMGWRQNDHGDMVFHNSGTRLLIDGQTDPHVISGCNVEDDFGFSWGFNQYQTRWVAMLDHAEEYATARVRIPLRKGDNQLLIKTNNRQNRDRLIWAVNCVID